MSIDKTTAGYFGLIFLLFFIGVPATAQNSSSASGKCPGPIYKFNEVEKRARIIQYADTSMLTMAAREYNFHGTIHADLVLCRSGQVTDVQLREQLPQNLSDFVLAAMSSIEFAPAELNFHTVSQRTQYELSINDDNNVKQIDATQAEGRLVEELDVIGNRGMEKEEVLKSIKTRPGEVYKQAQVQDDLSALLRTGHFNKLNTRVTVEDAPRGGVRVIFEVNELPLIAKISIVRNKPMPNSVLNDFVTVPELDDILNELARRKIDLQPGRPFDPLIVTRATEAIEAYYRSHGWINVKVDASVENLLPTEVKVTFKVYGRFF